MKDNFGLSNRTVQIALEALDSMPEGSILDRMVIDERKVLGIAVSRNVVLEWTTTSGQNSTQAAGVE